MFSVSFLSDKRRIYSVLLLMLLPFLEKRKRIHHTLIVLRDVKRKMIYKKRKSNGNWI